MVVREVWHGMSFISSPTGLTVTPATAPGTELDATNLTARRSVDFSRVRVRQVYAECIGKISAALTTAKFKIYNISDASDFTIATVMDNTATTLVTTSVQTPTIPSAAKNLALYLEGDGAKVFTIYSATLYWLE